MYLLSSILSIINFICGVLSIFSLFFSDIFAAMLFIFFGMIFDLLDGAAARKYNSISEFGKELDSLSDIVTFCIAPSMLVYYISLYQLSIIGLLIVLGFSVCGLIRLARFNAKQSNLSTFIGMPVPFAAFCLMGVSFLQHPVIVAFCTCLLGYLMVSCIKFPHFKNNGNWESGNGIS
ncbi:CDP-diacylglycerol--serine O-phosphatidyltransferase [Bacillales bacterium AN1005]